MVLRMLLRLHVYILREVRESINQSTEGGWCGWGVLIFGRWRFAVAFNLAACKNFSRAVQQKVKKKMDGIG